MRTENSAARRKQYSTACTPHTIRPHPTSAFVLEDDLEAHTLESLESQLTASLSVCAIVIEIGLAGEATIRNNPHALHLITERKESRTKNRIEGQRKTAPGQHGRIPDPRFLGVLALFAHQFSKRTQMPSAAQFGPEK